MINTFITFFLLIRAKKYSEPEDILQCLQDLSDEEREEYVDFSDESEGEDELIHYDMHS